MHNVDTFAFTGEPAWHGIGTEVPEEMTPQQAIVAGGLDWEVVKAKLFAEFQPMPTTDAGVPEVKRLDVVGRYCTIRVDTMAVLGQVDEQFRVVQNGAIALFLERLFQTADAPCIETVGALGAGEQCFMLAKLPDVRDIGKDDPVEPYLLVSWGHSSDHPIRVMFTRIRVVCQNTVQAAIAGAQHIAKVPHIGNPENQLEYVRGVLASEGTYWDQLTEAFNSMRDRKIKKDEVDSFLAQMFPQAENRHTGEVRPTDIVLGKREHVRQLLEEGPGADKAGMTRWGLYNATTHWLDYRSGAASAKDARDRFFYSQSGAGARIRNKAFNLLTAKGSLA